MRILAIVFVIVSCGGSVFAQDKDPTPIHSSTTIPATARFEIVQSTIAARWMFKLDRQTGLVYQFVKDKNDVSSWEKMQISDLPASPASGVHYEIFMSGIAARFMLLMNLDSGKTWQLQSLTDPTTKELSYSWFPLQ